jgi:predicted nucleic acid-binding Zn ribbon protein
MTAVIQSLGHYVTESMKSGNEPEAQTFLQRP